MLDDDVIESHQDTVPPIGQPHTRGPSPISFQFEDPLQSLGDTLDELFDGGEPYFVPGVCRPITSDSNAFSVTAKLCPPDPDATYDIHHPIETRIWCDVTPRQLDLYVSSNCEPWRVATFLEVIQQNYPSITYKPSLPSISEQPPDTSTSADEHTSSP